MSIHTGEIVKALVAYAGSPEDPLVGRLGWFLSRHDLFQCERCGAEHEDCTKIEHEPGCSAAALLAVIQALRAECPHKSSPIPLEQLIDLPNSPILELSR
jgi:hypothetical protein